MGQIPNNEDWRKATRMIDLDPPFGVACYEGEYNPTQAEWSGRHVGVYGNIDAAEAWLRGEAEKPPTPIWRNVP